MMMNRRLGHFVLAFVLLTLGLTAYQNAGFISATDAIAVKPVSPDARRVPASQPLVSPQAAPISAGNPQLWYQYNIEIPSRDHEQMYSPKNLRFTALALARTQVHMISRKLWMDKKSRQFFMSNVVPILRARKISIAINSPAALWLGCRPSEVQISALEMEASVISGIQSATGLRVSHLALQSIMSRPSPADDASLSDISSFPKCQNPGDYTTEMRVNDVVNYVEFMEKKFPGLKVGTIDALLAHENSLNGKVSYKDAYGMIYRRLQARGLNLGFVMMDHPFEYMGDTSYAEIRALVNYFKAREIPVGLIVTSAVRHPVVDATTGEDISLQRFQEKSRVYMQQVFRSGIPFSFYVQTSWYQPINQDRPQLELVVDFSDVMDGETYSHYRKCTRAEYFDEDKSLRDIPKYRTNPLKHFNESGKYRGRCAPVL